MFFGFLYAYEHLWTFSVSVWICLFHVFTSWSISWTHFILHILFGAGGQGMPFRAWFRIWVHQVKEAAKNHKNQFRTANSGDGRREREKERERERERVSEWEREGKRITRQRRKKLNSENKKKKKRHPKSEKKKKKKLNSENKKKKKNMRHAKSEKKKKENVPHKALDEKKKAWKKKKKRKKKKKVFAHSNKFSLSARKKIYNDYNNGKKLEWIQVVSKISLDVLLLQKIKLEVFFYKNRGEHRKTTITAICNFVW